MDALSLTPLASHQRTRPDQPIVAQRRGLMDAKVGPPAEDSTVCWRPGEDDVADNWLAFNNGLGGYVDETCDVPLIERPEDWGKNV